LSRQSNTGQSIKTATIVNTSSSKPVIHQIDFNMIIMIIKILDQQINQIIVSAVQNKNITTKHIFQENNLKFEICSLQDNSSLE